MGFEELCSHVLRLEAELAETRRKLAILEANAGRGEKMLLSAHDVAVKACKSTGWVGKKRREGTIPEEAYVKHNQRVFFYKRSWIENSHNWAQLLGSSR